MFAEETDLVILASWTHLLEKFFSGQIVKYVRHTATLRFGPPPLTLNVVFFAL